MMSQPSHKSKLPLIIVGAIIVLFIGVAIGMHSKTTPKLSLDIKKPMPMNGEKYTSF